MTAVGLAFVPMVVEAAWSSRNERRLRQRGAVEPPDDVIAAMSIVYPLAFLFMAGEGWLRAQDADGFFAAGLACWVAAKAIKYAAMASLGDRWSFRVLVVTGAPLVRSGPYRWLRHPNYVGVVGELCAMALLCPAPVTGPLGILAMGVLLRRRVIVEERAMGMRR